MMKNRFCYTYLRPRLVTFKLLNIKRGTFNEGNSKVNMVSLCLLTYRFGWLDFTRYHNCWQLTRAFFYLALNSKVFYKEIDINVWEGQMQNNKIYFTNTEYEILKKFGIWTDNIKDIMLREKIRYITIMGTDLRLKK